MIAILRVHCDREGTADEQAGIGGKPGRADITRAEQPPPSARVMGVCRQWKNRGKQDDQGGSSTNEHKAPSEVRKKNARSRQPAPRIGVYYPRSADYGLRDFSPGASVTS